MSVSLDPPLVVVSIGNQARLNHLLPRSMRYGVSFLREGDEIFSRHFAGRPVEGLQVPFVRKKDMPVLDGAIGCVVARVVDIHPAGDHTFYIGQVEYLEAHAARPLLFFAGQYRALDPEPKQPMEAWLDDELFFFDPGGTL
jgi:flavin reductase (DIM6/NTAB) family NADH-FMN oxidoreductase RutF